MGSRKRKQQVKAATQSRKQLCAARREVEPCLPQEDPVPASPEPPISPRLVSLPVSALPEEYLASLGPEEPPLLVSAPLLPVFAPPAESHISLIPPESPSLPEPATPISLGVHALPPAISVGIQATPEELPDLPPDDMESIRVAGCTVGEYVGDGQGDRESPTEATSTNLDNVDADPGLDNQSLDNEEDSSDSAHPLFIFYNCESTGFSFYKEHITDIAAKVVASPVSVNTPTFSSLVKTSLHIPASVIFYVITQVTKVTGITTTMLRGERPFSVVFPLFMEWLATTTKHVSDATDTPHYPVLVAHNGFGFDFPILYAEVERRPGQLATSIFETNRIHFSDTLPLLRKMKKDGNQHLAGVSLGMGALHKHILGTDIDGAHRVMPDVIAMERVMTHPLLASCLSNLPIRSAKKQGCLWVDMKRLHQRCTSLIKSLGKPAVTTAQAKRLDVLGLDYQDLVKLHSESKDTEDFLKILKDRGVNSKPLREKLGKHFHQQSAKPPKPHT